MQERTWNGGMYDLRTPVFPHPYNTFPAALLPWELLDEEKELFRLAERGGVCFARVERQVCEDLFRIRVTTDPSCLEDNERSHLLFVSSADLHSMTEIFRIPAAIMPEELLGDDGALRQVVGRCGACFACVEREIDWDLYAIRIAADPRSLGDEERSYRIYISLAELQVYAKATRRQQKHIDPPSPTNPSEPPGRKDVEFKALPPIAISEEEIRKAEGTMDPLKEHPLVHRHRPGSKFLRRLRQWIDLLLFRAVLAALEYQKDLQGAVRHALVLRRWSGKRLINIEDMYEKDHRTYWSIQIFVPVSYA